MHFGEEENNMSKVTIVTIYDPRPNYGNRLQNYAMQEILRDKGFEVTSLSWESELFDSLKQRIKIIINLLTRYKLTKHREYWRSLPLKCASFKKFNKKYIATTKIKCLDDINIEETDYFVVGSDQVWNAEWYGHDVIKKNIYLLTFADSKQKIAIAPSFGCDDLPEEWKEWFANGLSNFSFLSVREDAGCKIIKSLTGQDVPVIIDPTLMLETQKWRQLERKAAGIDSKCEYIFAYFLGEVSEEQQTYINGLSGAHKCKVYSIMDTSNKALYASDPAQFLYLIDHAKIVLTDSFHACVFSFLFDKPFVVFRRNGVDTMFSRIETFLKMFHLETRSFNVNMGFDVLTHDYSEGYSALLKERNKENEFLDRCFNT